MDGPWFLAPDGSLSRDCCRAHDVAECLPAEALPISDVADFFVQSASTFAMILKYLPNVPRLKGNYRRRADGTWRLIKDLYFVVEDHNFLLGDGYTAISSIISHGRQRECTSQQRIPGLQFRWLWAGEEAEKLIEKQIDLQHCA
ncbi:hypothetical protein B0H14DRAFT_2579209 [Mycena olivaceomarginata]|nr:hypothetical protein B0H14DRAFT_2579209 [Mycena olivaceomarginata]